MAAGAMTELVTPRQVDWVLSQELWRVLRMEPSCSFLYSVHNLYIRLLLPVSLSYILVTWSLELGLLIFAFR